MERPYYYKYPYRSRKNSLCNLDLKVKYPKMSRGWDVPVYLPRRSRTACQTSKCRKCTCIVLIQIAIFFACGVLFENHTRLLRGAVKVENFQAAALKIRGGFEMVTESTLYRNTPAEEELQDPEKQAEMFNAQGAVDEGEEYQPRDPAAKAMQSLLQERAQKKLNSNFDTFPRDPAQDAVAGVRVVLPDSDRLAPVIQDVPNNFAAIDQPFQSNGQLPAQVDITGNEAAPRNLLPLHDTQEDIKHDSSFGSFQDFKQARVKLFEKSGFDNHVESAQNVPTVQVQPVEPTIAQQINPLDNRMPQLLFEGAEPMNNNHVSANKEIPAQNYIQPDSVVALPVQNPIPADNIAALSAQNPIRVENVAALPAQNPIPVENVAALPAQNPIPVENVAALPVVESQQGVTILRPEPSLVEETQPFENPQLIQNQENLGPVAEAQPLPFQQDAQQPTNPPDVVQVEPEPEPEEKPVDPQAMTFVWLKAFEDSAKPNVVDCLSGVPIRAYNPNTPVTYFQSERNANDLVEHSAFRAAAFAKIHLEKTWLGGVAADEAHRDIQSSGLGSTQTTSLTIRNVLNTVVEEIKKLTGKPVIKMLDVGCGDMVWMHQFLMARDDIDFTGVEIVPQLTEHHQRSYAAFKNWKFVTTDILNVDINEKFDLIIARHLTAHLTNRDTMQALEKFSNSQGTFLLATTYPQEEVNTELQLTNPAVMNMRTVCIEHSAIDRWIVSPSIHNKGTISTHQNYSRSKLGKLDPDVGNPTH
ncbi:hypothetical protein CAPTEDRAFT_210472 [Capitella teleta]|uniref:Methyltransferase domain-containing protein n=1 Tax=Capitella teleta TaxID=283909 RepID=R7VKB2_CAPTE|nr:hypothetical protein CAPTEDRAFT_210472 [Capitella teleta]|eukprot:ELU17186.1 hypothetical protein CAPTEDRAFT_210472 [Capitella teleta]